MKITIDRISDKYQVTFKDGKQVWKRDLRGTDGEEYGIWESKWCASLKPGDEIDVEIKRIGQYKNIITPEAMKAKPFGGSRRDDELHAKIDKILSLLENKQNLESKGANFTGVDPNTPF